MEKQVKGISLILFGILLNVAALAAGAYLASDLGFPLCLAGIVSGIAGLVFVFERNS